MRKCFAGKIEDRYNELLRIEDPERLALELTVAAGHTVGHGMSETCHRRFVSTVRRYSNDLAGLRRYLTNFVLAGNGLGVIR